MDPLCLEFVNTRCAWYETHSPFSDPLWDQEWMDSLCSKWNLPTVCVGDPGAETSLGELRDFSGHIVDSWCAKAMVPEDILGQLNARIASFHAEQELRAETGKGVGITYRFVTACKGGGVRRLSYEVLVSFALSIANDGKRIKTCQNPDCGWVFLDESKSGTRRWCGDTCASLMRVRRFRAVHNGSEEVSDAAGMRAASALADTSEPSGMLTCAPANPSAEASKA